MTKPNHQSRRVAFDPRADSMLAWLQRTAAIYAGDPTRAPSYSQLVRRAVGLYADHMASMLHSARLDGRTTPHPEELAAERQALEDYSRWVDAAPPGLLIDHSGRLLDWQEAIVGGIDLGLTIPTKEAA